MARSKEYIAIKNFLHNELGLTKEEIREVTLDVVRDEARKKVQTMLQGADTKKLLTDAVMKQAENILGGTGYSWDKNRLVETIGKALGARLVVTMKGE